MNEPSPSAPDDLASLIGANRVRRPARGIVWLLLLAALIGGGVFFWRHQAANAAAGPPPYVMEAVRRGDIRLVITATGNLEPTNEVTIGSELSGTASEVYVDINDRVKKGQPLARIAIRRLNQQTNSSRAALNAAKAKVNQVKATLMENEATLARLEELYRLSGGQTPSKADRVTAQAAVARAQADLGSAEAAVEQAKADVEANENDQAKAVLISPIDGIVLSRNLEPGQTVAASFTAPELFVIAENLEHMKLKVAVAEMDIGRVRAGQTATFTVDAWPGRSYQAKVTKVAFGSSVTDNVVTYETELEVSNADLSLRPGMTATADILAAESRGALLVPHAALRFDPAAAAAARPNPAAKKSFVQSLIPGPPRRGGAGPRPAAEEAPAEKKALGAARVWTVRDGQPEPITVTIGLSDSRYTEVSGAGIAENLPIILRAQPAMP